LGIGKLLENKRGKNKIQVSRIIFQIKPTPKKGGTKHQKLTKRRGRNEKRKQVGWYT